MKSTIRFYIFLLATTSWAGFGSLISSWTPAGGPGSPNPEGIAWDGTYVWVRCTYSGHRPMTLKCVSSTGSVVSSFTCPVYRESIYGIYGYGMDYRLIGGQPRLEVAALDALNNASYIYRVTTAGSLASSVRVPAAGLFIRGVCWDGANYWITSTDNLETFTRIHRLNNNGSALASYMLGRPGIAHGIAYQGPYLWFPVDYSSPTNSFFGACKTTATGSVIASFGNSPYIHQGTHDCTYENNHLWLTDDRSVLCFDVRTCEPGIVPASLGRVKALYR